MRTPVIAALTLITLTAGARGFAHRTADGAVPPTDIGTIADPPTVAATPVDGSPVATGIIVTGTVTSADGGAPLSGARVSLQSLGPVVVTDAAGRYSITLGDQLADHAVAMRITLAGFREATRTVTLRGDTVRVDIVLDPVSLTLDEAKRRVLIETDVRRQNASKTGALQSAALPAYGIMPATLGRAYERDAAGTAAGGVYDPEFDTESYDRIYENPYLSPAANPLSTFSIDVDRASYSNVRRFVREGRRPPPDAVRVEELINYFTYDLPEPVRGQPFSVTTEIAAAPWNPRHRLLRIGLQAKSIDTRSMPPGNIVFLIDVSGSMQSPDKLPLLKQSFGLLVDELRENDRVAIVVYAGAAGLVLPSTAGDRKDAIMDAINALEAGGSTAGGAGIRLAYDVAKKNFIAGGNNRVILATDGDFNIGESSDAAMSRLIEEKRKEGVFLTVLGFGTGNLKDSKMEQLADKGNGNYAYIDDLMEARKVLVHEMGGTLLTVAKDVKLQVEFNPERVQGYRLIGYENRLLAAEDFNDDTKDAGELGAGHSVTALYEVVPAGIESDVNIRGLDSLRYTRPAARANASKGGELAFVKLRYKEPDGEKSRLLEQPVANVVAKPSRDFLFASAVAELGMLLRDSEHRGQATLASAIGLARDGLGEDREGYRAEFIKLAEQVRALDLLVADDHDGPVKAPRPRR